MIANRKKELRAQTKLEISKLCEERIRQSDILIQNNLLSLSEYLRAEQIFIYFSMDREVSTREIIADALMKKKRLALPRVKGGGIMDFAEIFSIDELEANERSFAIPEPSKSARRLIPGAGDIIIIPALRYDIKGFRLGFGGGYYDRFLSDCKAIKIGLGREELLIDKVPIEAHDISVDILITETKIARLK